MYDGKHVLIIFDDLTKQAEAYRAISLLLRRPPAAGLPRRRLLPALPVAGAPAKLSDELGGGSMTGLPLIETKANDISAYIPTNVISITDGPVLPGDRPVQPGCAAGDQRRCVGVPRRRRRADQGDEGGGGLAAAGSVPVPRAGSVRRLRLGPGRGVKAQLERGRGWSSCSSSRSIPMSVEDQVARSSWAPKGTWIRFRWKTFPRFESELLSHLKARHAGILSDIRETKKLSEETRSGWSNR